MMDGEVLYLHFINQLTLSAMDSATTSANSMIMMGVV